MLTYRGREHSKLAPYDKLGPYSLRAPTGQYDLLGNALFTEGDVLIDSVHRFKGRAAPCVVFTEIDFETLDDQAVRRHFRRRDAGHDEAHARGVGDVRAGVDGSIGVTPVRGFPGLPRSSSRAARK